MSARDVALGAATGGAVATQTYVDDVFSTYLYTGNGATQTINNGIDLAGKGGLVWNQSRSNAYGGYISDTARGTNRRIQPCSTSEQLTVTQDVTAFNSNGFTMGNDAGINQSSAQYTSWTFRKAANFFDVVTYTGTGSARTIAHSLGVAPGMIIVKRTSPFGGDWQVYSNGMTSAAYSMQLNLTAAQASTPTVWNSTAPTSSVFSIGADSTVNFFNATYVAYLYAHDTSSTGIIQCGSFFTNSSANSNIQQTLGWEPQFLLIKRANFVAEDWKIIDTMRGWRTTSSGSGSANVLYPNNTLSEAAAGLGIRLLSNGFWGYPTGLSPSSTYIYMAIRRPNKPPTTGTQVFNVSTWTQTGGL
jgi:hypothetical protein